MKEQLPAISEELIQQYLVQGEGSRVEFKTVLREPSLLARIIASFANADGGFILVGIREPDEIVGTDIRLLARIHEAAISLLSPRPQTQVKEVTIDGKAIGVVAVRPSDALVFAEGSAFVRVDETSMVMPPDQILAKLNVATPSLRDLAKTIAQQTKKIDKLTRQFKESGSFKEKMKDYVIGGVIGWVIGVLPQVIAWWLKKP
jgi:predicted HTH transcriptional regulator